MIAPLLASLLVAGTMTPREQDEVDRHVRTILADEAFGFCHDEEYPLLVEEKQWCSFVEGGNTRCPAFDAACEAPLAEIVGIPGPLSTRKVSEKEDLQRGDGQGPARREEPEIKEVTVPNFGGFAQVLFFLIVGVAVVLIVMAIARNVIKGKDPEATPEPDGDAVDPEAMADAAARRAMETDVDRLLAMARDSAGKGELADAVDFAHAALLRRLDHEGMIRLHYARTNGDYVRDLRENAELRGPVREVLRRVDRAHFGTEPPTRSLFEEIFSRVGSIVKKAGPLAAFALALLTAGVACEDDIPGRKSYPWQYSPSGTEGVTRLLEARGFEAGFRVTKMTSFSEETHFGGLVIVMLQGSEASDEEWDALDEWIQEGGRLVVAGAQVPPWLDADYTVGFSDAKVWVPPSVAPEFAVPYVELPEGYAVEDRSSGEVLLEREGEVFAVRYEHGMGNVVVMAGDQLFTNASLPIADNAIFVESLLGDLGQKIEFIDAWAAAGADDPLESIRRTHLTPAVVQLLLLILALYLWRGVRFGRARDPIPPSRRAFVQHAEAMGQHYTKARATGHAAGAYAGWVLDRLRDRFPTAAAGGLHGLAQQVARRSGRDETTVMRMLVEAHGAAESRTGAGSPGEDLALVRDLGRLMREIGGTS